MSRKAAAVGAVAGALLRIDESALGEHRVKRRARVPLAEHEVVPAGPVRLVRPDPQHTCVEDGQHVGGGKAAPHMGSGGGRAHLQDPPAHRESALGHIVGVEVHHLPANAWDRAIAPMRSRLSFSHTFWKAGLAKAGGC